jgi:hypothetical protein
MNKKEKEIKVYTYKVQHLMSLGNVLLEECKSLEHARHRAKLISVGGTMHRGPVTRVAHTEGQSISNRSYNGYEIRTRKTDDGWYEAYIIVCKSNGNGRAVEVVANPITERYELWGREMGFREYEESQLEPKFKSDERYAKADKIDRLEYVPPVRVERIDSEDRTVTDLYNQMRAEEEEEKK